MKPAPFDYEAPETVDRALDLLAQHGDSAKILAGGQSLVPLLNFRLARPALIVDINRVADLGYLRRENGSLALGALARQRAVELSPLVRQDCPLLAEALGHVGHFQIRNRGTVVGSLAHADPAAEMPAVALALGAELRLASARGVRSLPAADFAVSYLTTALEPDELLLEARYPVAQPRTGYAFAELARRHGDFALVGVAVAATLDASLRRCEDLRLAFAGVGPVPVLFADPDGSLRDQSVSPTAVAAAAQAAAAALEPESDIHASGAYRRELAAVLAERALNVALARARGATHAG